MATEFEQALHDLESGKTPVPPESMAKLSSPTREESEQFVACFRALGDERRRHITAQMVASAEESFHLDYRDLFRECLEDADPEVRSQAVEGLWEDERVDLVQRLINLLKNDHDPRVRAAAATGLGRFIRLAEFDAIHERYGARAREALESVIRDEHEDLNVVRRAIESIAFINEDSVRRMIAWAYDHGEFLMRVSAVFAMGRSADPVWSETVLTELEDPAPEMRFEAARAAGELQLRRAVPRLAGLLGKADREVQGMAIWALGQIGGKDARRLLESIAAGEDDVAATAAEEALDEIEFADGVLDLMLVDPDESEMVEVDLLGEDDELDDEFDDDLAAFDDEEYDDEDDWPDEVIDL